MFNVTGAKLWLKLVMNMNNHKLEAKLDKGNYRDEELVEIKMALNLPYNQNWAEFERVNGEINIDGNHYKYVKQKLYNDTLILLCIPDNSKTAVKQNTNDYFGKVNGAPSDNAKRNVITKNQLGDYDADEADKKYVAAEENMICCNSFIAVLNNEFIFQKDRPPEYLL
ncbi:MAG TPA: hypothetical protein PL045_01645, partial [Chitinophagaceae bacterium]|nr:hypothetical protein [Chitinophagaceae bacterium]